MLAGVLWGVTGCSTAVSPGALPGGESGTGDPGRAAPGTAAPGTTSPGGTADRGGTGSFQDPDLGTAPGSAVVDGSAKPVRVQIASIGVDSALESLKKDGSGSLLPPVDFASAGWYSGGVAPGAVGPAVIAGHIDSSVGPAVFYRLSSLAAGDPVGVTLADGRVATFTVDRVIQIAKADFPTAEVYGAVPTAQLRLITCGGVFDDDWGHYLDNVVVFASETAISPQP
ncbi:hypothetical protein B7R22_01600 [Subtercola boreus]|uniref:Class F sortase n=2 Tax=Subtercola boreus TaxID=120213 RepID=A0A3E0W7C5_9MICO|nr:hypothetical protein B7R22_01600 [Subtercola boreus]